MSTIVRKGLSELDIHAFWHNSDYENNAYISDSFDDDYLKTIEDELGYKLPSSYVEFMKKQNGGTPVNTNHRTLEPTSWAEDHVAITGIYGIGSEKSYSLCGSTGSKFWIDNWGYPAIGVYFADCPSAGHDMLCFDYRNCGVMGEPKIVHIDQEFDYKITIVAESFESFILGLENDDKFE